MRNPDPNFERLHKALFGGQPDRVPMAEITIDEGAKESFLGKPVNDFATDLEFYVNAGYDYITLGRRIAGFPPIWDAARLENYYDVQRQVAHGSVDGVIRDWDDFKGYAWIKPEELDFRILDVAEKILPKEMKVIRYLSPVFQMTWLLMGFENFCIKQIEEPSFLEAMFDRIFELVYREFEDALQREIVGAIWYGDDIAIKDRLLVNPAVLRKHIFPRIKLMGEGCKERGIPFLYHTDGNVSEVMEDIIDAGVNALHPIDPLGMNIYEVKREYGHRLCLIGNVDVDLLLRGTPERIMEDTKEHLRGLAPGGGYVAGSGNSIPRAIPVENYVALLQTVREYGTYPLEID